MADMSQVRLAAYLYYDDFGYYPVTGSSLAPTVNGWLLLEEEITFGSRPYMLELPHDPLNRDSYRYRYASNGLEYVMEYTAEQEGIRRLQGW